MAKKNQPQAEKEQKVQTRYDRKMEARRKQEEKDKREEKIMRIGAIVVCIAIAAAIIGSIGASVWSRKAVTKDAYVTIGSHDVTKLEYDYYYQATLGNYSTMLSYMGVDVTADLASQQYTQDLTWKDFFDELTVEQVKQTKALLDDAAANNFTYDVSQEYTNAINNLKANADAQGVSLGQYYKMAYGEYATEKNMEAFLKEQMLATAYYDYLMEQNTPEAQEIKEHYEKNVLDYDKVDYRSFAFTAETEDGASQEESGQAMAEAKKAAEAMKAAREGGADFKALCIENASEEDKATYEDAQSDASLREGASYSGSAAAIRGWLYEDGRTAGELAVIEDTAGSQVYVVEFLNRYYDETEEANISNAIASQKASEYVSGLMEGYSVTDHKGELRYLTVETVEEGIAEEGSAEDIEEEAEADTDIGAQEETTPQE